MTPYIITDHYWIVGDENRLWSSAASAYVSPDDIDYVRWRVDGRRPTHVLLEADIDEILAAAGHGDRAPHPPKRKVPKSIISARLIAAGKIAAAKAALEADPEAWARWVASDKTEVDFDDPAALALLNAIGADPDVILAP